MPWRKGLGRMISETGKIQGFTKVAPPAEDSDSDQEVVDIIGPTHKRTKLFQVSEFVALNGGSVQRGRGHATELQFLLNKQDRATKSSGSDFVRRLGTVLEKDLDLCDKALQLLRLHDTQKIDAIETLRAMTLLLQGFPVLLDDFRAHFPPEQVTLAAATKSHESFTNVFAAVDKIKEHLPKRQLHQLIAALASYREPSLDSYSEVLEAIRTIVPQQEHRSLLASALPRPCVPGRAHWFGHPHNRSGIAASTAAATGSDPAVVNAQPVSQVTPAVVKAQPVRRRSKKLSVPQSLEATPSDLLPQTTRTQLVASGDVGSVASSEPMSQVGNFAAPFQHGAETNVPSALHEQGVGVFGQPPVGAPSGAAGLSAAVKVPLVGVASGAAVISAATKVAAKKRVRPSPLGARDGRSPAVPGRSGTQFGMASQVRFASFNAPNDTATAAANSLHQRAVALGQAFASITDPSLSSQMARASTNATTATLFAAQVGLPKPGVSGVGDLSLSSPMLRVSANPASVNSMPTPKPAPNLVSSQPGNPQTTEDQPLVDDQLQLTTDT